MDKKGLLAGLAIAASVLIGVIIGIGIIGFQVKKSIIRRTFPSAERDTAGSGKKSKSASGIWKSRKKTYRRPLRN